MRFLQKILLSGAASVAMAAGAAPALAQTDGDAALEADAGTDEIIVTARFKNESLQDVPQAISAFGEETLTKIAARDITDLAPSSRHFRTRRRSSFAALAHRASNRPRRARSACRSTASM